MHRLQYVRVGGSLAAVPTQTIERAGLILSAFRAEQPRLTLAALARRLELSQSTVYRYAATLVACGLLEHDERHGGYRLGPRVIELANVALDQLAVRKAALDEMDRLRDDFGLLVNLGVLFEGDVLHLAHAAPRDWPRWQTTPGRRAVAHCTALGKVLLAHEDWASACARIDRFGWRPYTAHSITDLERLRAELHRVRDQGYARDVQERRLGVTCLAAPIYESGGRISAALSITGKSEVMTPVLQSTALPRLLNAAARISLQLGHGDAAAYL